MSKATTPSVDSSEATAVTQNEDEASLAWETKRQEWLKPTAHGQRRASKVTVDRLSAALNPQNNEAQKSTDRSAQHRDLIRVDLVL